MKKFLATIISIVLILNIYAIPVSASGNGTLSMSGASGKQGDTVTVSVNLNSNPGLISMKFTISYDSDLELTGVSNSGVLAGWTTPSPTISSPYTIRWADSLATSNATATGKLLTLTFKIKDTAIVGNKTITLTFAESRDVNGEKNTFNSTSATIKVNCKTHTYGAYSKVNNAQHQRVCSTCGNVETTNHNWNVGTTTKEANCQDTGNKKYTCTTCQAEKNETIAKTNNHKYGSWSVTKKATCTTTGTEIRTCSVCSKVDTKSINALGHNFANSTVTKQPTCTETGTESGKCTRCGQTTTNTLKAKGHKFGAWKETKAATCTEKGIQERICSACQTKTNREVDALGHDFENPVVVKEATISTTGLMEGKCKRCGETTSEVIPCSAKDETTGILFEAAEGVFAEGTQMQVVEIAEGDVVYENITNALSDVTGKFVVFDVNALLNDAKVQPNGKVKVTFNVPEGFGKNIAVYFVSDNGEIELIESVVSGDGKTVVAELSHFSFYAIADLDSIEDEKEEKTDADITTNEKNENNSNTTKWIIISGAVVIAIVGTVVVIVFMKKKKNITE